MTQEEKDLLFIELSAKLHYGVKVQTSLFENPTSIKGIAEDECWIYSDEDNYEWINIEEVKPYLRPMESMTDEEQRTLNSMCYGVEMVSRLSGLKMFNKAFNWLNENHFDYRGLILMGLAIEAPEDMYKTE